MITASHQTFSSQKKHLSGQIKFGQTNSLYVINGNFIEYAKNNECSHNFQSLSYTLSKSANSTISYISWIYWPDMCIFCATQSYVARWHDILMLQLVNVWSKSNTSPFKLMETLLLQIYTSAFYLVVWFWESPCL